MEIDWVPADIGGAPEQQGVLRGTSLPFLACLWWKISVSPGIGWVLQMNGESTPAATVATAGARHANADGSAQRLSLRAQVTQGGRKS